MCVALKYDAYSLSHDYAATAITTGPSDITALEEDPSATTAVTPAMFSTADRRNRYRATHLQPAAARLVRPATHARCDEHVYEPTTNHESVTSSRDHRTFTDFAD